jgi:hypothetical protein
MRYNCCFFLNFVPLHIESPYNFGGKKPSAEGKILNYGGGIYNYIITQTESYNEHIFVALISMKFGSLGYFFSFFN